VSLLQRFRENWVRPALFFGNNPISLAGGAITSASGVTMIGYWLVEMLGRPNDNPTSASSSSCCCRQCSSAADSDPDWRLHPPAKASKGRVKFLRSFPKSISTTGCSATDWILCWWQRS
jgi:hypothetical protein